MDPSVIAKLKARYPDMAIDAIHDPYYGEERIRIVPPAGKFLFHIEVEVPPGCYLVWTRICYHGNEETNKAMAIVGCGEDVCINLLLNSIEVCSKELLQPILDHAVAVGIPKEEIVAGAKLLMDVAKRPIKEVNAELVRRANEVKAVRMPDLQKRVAKIQEIMK